MRLLLIHTGGTIGMAETEKGLAPRAGMVEAAIQQKLPQEAELIAHVFSPLLDSADIGPAHWNRILDIIEDNPSLPVIITHGTDTMAFTGAALDQALAGEDRCVILCGSMLPLGQNGDAQDNLALALDAAFANQPGTKLAFAGQLLDAAGLIKSHSHALDAFRSQPQGRAKIPQQRRFGAQRLAILTLSPAMPAAMLAAALLALDGAVLRVFGTGTMMDDRELEAALSAAIAAGKRIRAVSQCPMGGLAPGSYAAGSRLFALGVENGGNQTPEAALIDLWLNMP